MTSSYLTELALRAAVNTSNRTLTREGSQAEAIRSIAFTRTQELIQANSSYSPIATQMKMQSTTISLALKGITLAYNAISKQLIELSHQRLSFDKERQAGIATFLVPTSKEENDLSIEEKIIKYFIELSFKNPTFANYLGIHHAEGVTERGAKFYSILPFYRMSEALTQPISSTKPLDRQRTAINLFFKSALPGAIADIDNGFQTDCRFIAFWESAFQRKNYLNNRRAPRFIMMGLSNLLWNLQHPVDPETGFPLGLNRCIEMCRSVEIYLNQLLNTESTPYLQTISNDENGLMSFMRKLEIHTKALRAAYAEEQLHELNLDEITNSAHRTLRIMDQSVLKLIYKLDNPMTRKVDHDEKAAENMAYMISYLNQLFNRNPDLIEIIQPVPTWIPHASMMNKPPRTIMDILIVFCHLSWRERNRLYEKISKNNTTSSLEFMNMLKKFDKKFVHPIKELSKIELNSTIFSPKLQDVSCLTARRLIPLLCLVINDFRVDVTYHHMDSSKKDQEVTKFLSGKQQTQAISDSAETGNGYYNWSLSFFIKMSKEATVEIEKLTNRQYRLARMTELLDSVCDLVQNEHGFLRTEIFQSFLLKLLHKVKDECLSLDKFVVKIDLYLSQDERMSRGIRAILRAMTNEIMHSLILFNQSSENLERLIRAPYFSDQQRKLLIAKIGSITEQFSALFAEETDLSSLIDKTPRSITTEIEIAKSCKTAEIKQVIALRKLAQQCYDALSSQSREGRKGSLLRELLSIFDNRLDFTEEQIRQIIMELTRITASYREAWLFQAAYGETRSARVLIAAIQDQGLNRVLPLASIIFAQTKISPSRPSNEQIINRIKSLQEENFWSESTSKLKFISFC